MAKKVLLINDLAGYGKVALSAMLPVLSYLKYETYNLPTAIVSNTLDYGKFDILDTTQYMKNTFGVWKAVQRYVGRNGETDAKADLRGRLYCTQLHGSLLSDENHL